MPMFTLDWHQLFGTPWSHLALAVSSIVCGAIIGVEREKKAIPAGLKTMILVALGSALFTMVSGLLPDATGNKGRIAAQIVLR